VGCADAVDEGGGGEGIAGLERLPAGGVGFEHCGCKKYKICDQNVRIWRCGVVGRRGEISGGG
jgi:hypothetical protein